ncbi:uncharacterized protein LOC134831043 [Culicoides brevitarsis]|uniref:uncharacterized protein LOC134831043 n=1 Tax=Culicoides brevitarsis TaxID=469753 RepID=UPI00307B39FD
MKIFVFCILLAVVCAYPTDTQVKTNEDHHDVPLVPAAYAHRPLSHQQIPVKTLSEPVENHESKRDVVADPKKSHVDLPSAHDNSTPSFVKPVPVEQILGKINHETHPTTELKITEKPESSAETPVEKIAEHTPETNVAKSTEALIKSEADHQTEDKKTEAKENLKISESNSESSESTEKKHEQKSTDRKTRETDKVQREHEEKEGHQLAQTLPIAHSHESKELLPLKVSGHNQPKTDDLVEQHQPANIHSVPFNPHKEQEKIVHPHDLKEGENSRLVRDATKESHQVNGPIPVPHYVENSDVKHENKKETVSTEKLN